jgi:hypothetical protein
MKSKLPLEGDDVENYGFILYDPHGVTLGLMGSVLGELSVAEATTVNVTLTAAPKPKVLDILNGIGEEYTSHAPGRAEDRTGQDHYHVGR